MKNTSTFITIIITTLIVSLICSVVSICICSYIINEKNMQMIEILHIDDSEENKTHDADNKDDRYKRCIRAVEAKKRCRMIETLKVNEACSGL